MALDARLRSSIYQSLVPILGAEEANALMSEFPAREADELVTKQFLRAEILAMENRLTLRIGAAMATQTALFLAALKLFV